MTSRERILTTLDHRQPEGRVAIDLGATNATGISAIVYHKLKKLLGLNGGEIRVTDIMQQLAEVEIDVLDRLGGDVVMLRKLAMTMGVPFAGFQPGVLTDGTPCLQGDSYNPERMENGDLVFRKLTDGSDRVHPYPLPDRAGPFDEGRIVARLPVGAHAFARVYHPLSNVETLDQLDKFAFPELDEEELNFAKAEAIRLYEGTDKALCGIFQGNVFEMGQLYWGYQQFLENLMLEPELTESYFRRRTDAFLRDLDKYLDAVGPYIQIINFCDDLGTQQSLLISPQTYRDIIKPCHAELFARVKKKAPHVKVFFHSCGAVYPLIPDFIEIGVDILNPVQITASGMDPARLKREFGKRLVFWGGGVDTQSVLNGGSEAQVRQMAREMLDIFAPGGGYVFSQVHNIESCVPAENVLAAFETAKSYIVTKQ